MTPEATVTTQPTQLHSSFRFHLIPALAALLVACGGGSHGAPGAGSGSEAAGIDTSATSGSDGAVAVSPSSTGAGAGAAASGAGQAPSISSVALTPAVATLAKGTWQQYTATAIYDDGSRGDVTGSAAWSVSDPAIASVDAAGRVNGLAPGNVVVQVEVGGARAAAPLTVTDAVLQSISLSPTQPAVPLLIDQPFAATGIFSDFTQQDLTAQVAWSSSAPAIAVISAAGLAHPVSPGTAVIQASYGSISASTTLQVTNATLQYVDIEPALATVAAGFSITFDAMATFSDDSTFDVTAQATWTSDSAAVAFSAPGVARGVSKGTANVTASFGAMSDTVSVTVTDAVLQAITIDPRSVSTARDMTVNLSAYGSFSDGSTQDLTAFVVWSSSDVAIASISNATGSEGLLTTISGGNATVTASLSGVSASIPVTVTGAAISSVDVSAASSTLPAGYKLQLKAMASFDDGSSRDITAFATWTSSNTAVASVYTSSSLAGLVSGLSPGTVSINAALGGHAGSLSLVVTNARLHSVVVSPDSFSLAVGGTKQLKATGNFDDGSSLDLTTQCNWRSQSKSVASVTKQGLVTGLRSSRTPATILVRKGHFTDTASVTVQ